MPIFVSSQNVTWMENQSFVVEASEIGLKPGEWPDSIETDLGNGRLLRFYGIIKGGTRIYRQQSGIVMLHVLND